MKNKLTKAQRAGMHRYIVDQLSEIVLHHWRQALELEGFNKGIRQRKDGKIVIDASKFKKKKPKRKGARK